MFARVELTDDELFINFVFVNCLPLSYSQITTAAEQCGIEITTAM